MIGTIGYWVMLVFGCIGVVGVALATVVIMASAANELRLRYRGWRRERLMARQHADPLLDAAHEAATEGRVLLYTERWHTGTTEDWQ